MEKIKVMPEDIRPLIYFIVSMFRKENTHRSGMSAQDNYIGAYIERWVNKIPENLLFNKGLLVNKEFKVINDYFIYGPKTDKNAPDILGLKSKSKIIKFAIFNNTTWVLQSGMPYIEVKTFKENQKLVCVREAQLKDENYYVFVESNFEPDYLISMFEDTFFDDKYLNTLKMDESFILSNEDDLITQVEPLKNSINDPIGTIDLITVIKGKDFRARTKKCEEKENVCYIKKIEERNNVIRPNYSGLFGDLFPRQGTTDTYGYNSNWNKKQIIPIVCSNANKIMVKKVNKNSIIVETTGECFIYDRKLEANKIYSIEIAEFERSAGVPEYVGLKNQFVGNSGTTDELVNKLDELYKNALIS